MTLIIENIKNKKIKLSIKFIKDITILDKIDKIVFYLNYLFGKISINYKLL